MWPSSCASMVASVASSGITSIRPHHRTQPRPDRRDADAVQAADDVFFGLLIPGALGLDGRGTVRRFGLVVNGHCRLHLNAAQFLFKLLGLPKVVSPEPGLRFEAESLPEPIRQVLLLAVNRGGDP